MASVSDFPPSQFSVGQKVRLPDGEIGVVSSLDGISTNPTTGVSRRSIAVEVELKADRFSDVPGDRIVSRAWRFSTNNEGEINAGYEMLWFSEAELTSLD